MTNEDFLGVLQSIRFSESYWSLCDRHPLSSDTSYSAQKAEIVAAFRELNAEPRYDNRDRSYQIEAEKIGDVEWDALFVKQRFGIELMLSGLGPSGKVGSNFAVLAYEAKQLEDPKFLRNPFSGPAPYPRPHVGSIEELASLIREFLVLVRSVKEALRARAA